MKETILALSIIVLFGCSSNKQTSQSTPTAAASNLAPVPEPPPPPVAQALTTDEILRCDRRSVLYDQSKHKTQQEEEPPKLHVRNMKPGETAYIFSLLSKGGRVYVNGPDEIVPTARDGFTTMIRRVTDGFLADCDSPELWVWLDEGAQIKADPGSIYPVVGHIDVKPRKKVLTPPAIFFPSTGDIVARQP